MNQDMNTSIKPSKADLNGINRQMKEQFYKGFRDLLKERVCENPPDYKWIVKLYDEIKTRLCTILKEGSQKRKEIEEKMDVKLFGQIIENGAFTGENMHGLVNYVFDKCMELSVEAHLAKNTKNGRSKTHIKSIYFEQFPPRTQN